MKKAYIVLAHDAPGLVASLIQTLLLDGSHVVLHYDKSAPSRDTDIFSDLLTSSRERFLLAEPVEVRWGEWSVVRATLNALEKLSETGEVFDYVTLISGSCTVSKPLQLLDEFLARNQGSEFVESYDAVNHRWVADGAQLDRWQIFKFFNWKMSPRRFYLSNRIQAALGVNRKHPLDMKPRIGSQWWTLTWPTLLAVLELSRQGSIERFYRRTWIPDEHFFQTLVYHVVPDKSRMVNYNLMQYAFDEWGNPRYFYNDNYCELVASNRFFARKISPEANRLREKLESVVKMSPVGFTAHLGSDAIEDSSSSIAQASFWKDSPEYIFANASMQSPEYLAQHANREPLTNAKFFVVIGLDSQELDQVRGVLNAETDVRCHGRIFANEANYFEPDHEAGLSDSGYTVADRDSKQLEFLKLCLQDSQHRVVGFLVNPARDSSVRHLLWDLIMDPNSIVVHLKVTDSPVVNSADTAITLVAEELSQVAPVGSGSLLGQYTRMLEARTARDRARTEASIKKMLDQKETQLIGVESGTRPEVWLAILKSLIEMR